MNNIIWEGPEPVNRSACPYAVNFEIKPAPAKSLNSLESGRLIISVDLGPAKDILEVEARLENNAKRENLDKVQGNSRLKRYVSLSAPLAKRDSGATPWTGEISIPASWVEGGTVAFEKTGAATPMDSGNPFSLEITYRIKGGEACTARFHSQDAFHWAARPKERL
ncbi:MAG: hypothetical protein ACREA4_02025 [Nitrososphaera sp.]